MTHILATREFGTVDGFTIRAAMHDDTTATPHREKCYSPADIAAWKADEWSYVGIVVTASLAGVDLGEDSVWGMEYGTLGNGKDIDPLTTGDDETFANGNGHDLINNAMTEAEHKLQELRS
ncbi:hypothetical protein ACFWPX_30140 [Nocardia sp. NPDC058518]|uniref:hypothetical protein n=1 Tax=Nocardia sp. NPDC058518 TaxID=3346534 RepID=UPI00365C5DC0